MEIWDEEIRESRKRKEMDDIKEKEQKKKKERKRKDKLEKSKKDRTSGTKQFEIAKLWAAKMDRGKIAMAERDDNSRGLKRKTSNQVKAC